ncbi:MAG: NAD-binding protein [Chitinophagaceae bacterium]|nr:NAD-binding protein [Oligoflexus sp.]
MAQLLKLLAILLLLPVIGAVGFGFIEHLRPLDAIYMAFITLSTVGYEVVKPLSDGGKVFVIGFLMVSFTSFFYALSELGEMLVKGDLHRLIKRRIMDRQIKELSKHAIICGFGRMGQSVAMELHKKGIDFVVIDINPERIHLAVQEGWRCIRGDASEDSVLDEAGIHKAHSLTTVLPHDPDNLFCVMAARLLNKDLIIIARSNADSSVHKLKRAGATRIVSPYSTGAVKISQLMIHPELDDFMEIFSDREADVDLTVVHVKKDVIFFGNRLRDMDLNALGIMVIGLKKSGGKVSFPPDLDVILDENFVLILIGRVARLNEIFARDLK